MRRSPILHPSGGVARRSRDIAGEPGEAEMSVLLGLLSPLGVSLESEKGACGARFPREGGREGGAATSLRSKV